MPESDAAALETVLPSDPPTPPAADPVPTLEENIRLLAGVRDELSEMFAEDFSGQPPTVVQRRTSVQELERHDLRRDLHIKEANLMTAIVIQRGPAVGTS